MICRVADSAQGALRWIDLAQRCPYNRSMSKPVYALVGEDTYLQLEALTKIAGELPADAKRIDADGERAELAEVLDELRSFAMFGGAKVVVVRNADAFITRYREQLEEYVANPSSSGVLVLRLASLPMTQRIAKAIARVGQVVQCVPPKDRDLPRWIIDRAKREHKLTVPQDAAMLLADLIGCDLGRIDNELAKLALMKDDGKAQTSDIAAGVAFQREQEMKEMTAALAVGNTREALRRWRQLVQTDPSAEFRAVTWLTMWLEDARLALRGKSGAVAWKYRDQLPLLVKTSQKLGAAGLAAAVDRLADLDRRTKTGVGDSSRGVEQFILSFAEAK
jgi:DNA polymerase III delta subunit